MWSHSRLRARTSMRSVKHRVFELRSYAERSRNAFSFSSSFFLLFRHFLLDSLVLSTNSFVGRCFDHEKSTHQIAIIHAKASTRQHQIPKSRIFWRKIRKVQIKRVIFVCMCPFTFCKAVRFFFFHALLLFFILFILSVDFVYIILIYSCARSIHS